MYLVYFYVFFEFSFFLRHVLTMYNCLKDLNYRGKVAIDIDDLNNIDNTVVWRHGKLLKKIFRFFV